MISIKHKRQSSHIARSLLTTVALLLFLNSTTNLPAVACATCGCSEVCPISIMEASRDGASQSLLSNSIWGNIILKMAYARDAEIQKLNRRLNLANLGTVNAIATIAGTTIAQNTVSLATLNPPSGIQDSYVPGGIGLGLDGATNLAFSAKILLDYHYHKKLKTRQRIIRDQVEAILHHLEFSDNKCDDAKKDLSNLIGERAARECIELWQFSHLSAAIVPNN